MTTLYARSVPEHGCNMHTHTMQALPRMACAEQDGTPDGVLGALLHQALPKAVQCRWHLAPTPPEPLGAGA